MFSALAQCVSALALVCNNCVSALALAGRSGSVSFLVSHGAKESPLKRNKKKKEFCFQVKVGREIDPSPSRQCGH